MQLFLLPLVKYKTEEALVGKRWLEFSLAIKTKIWQLSPWIQGVPGEFFQLDKMTQGKEVKSVPSPKTGKYQSTHNYVEKELCFKKNCECGYWHIEVTKIKHKKQTRFVRQLLWNYNPGRRAFSPMPTSDAAKEKVEREETLRVEHRASEKGTGSLSRIRIRT